MKISLIGLPGSGKSTLAKRLCEVFSSEYVSSGELARKSGFAGSEAEKSGQLDPDETKIRNLVINATAGHESYVLDGFPRQKFQATLRGVEIDAVLYLDVPDTTVAIMRLLNRNRPDDRAEVIGERVKTYFSVTHPLLGYYQRNKKLRTIDASGTKDNTFANALIALCDFGLVRNHVREAIAAHGKII